MSDEGGSAVVQVSAVEQAAEDQQDRARVKTATALTITDRGVQLSTVEQGVAFATACQKSGLLPTQIKNGAQAFTIMMAGAELGLKPFAAWRGLYLTKANRLTLQTKTALAVVRASGQLEDYREWIEHEGTPQMVAVVSARRRGQATPIVATFSIDDAATAGLTAKKTNSSGQSYDSTYDKFPKDMLKSRARGRCLDEGFGDILNGMALEGIAEDADAAEADRNGRPTSEEQEQKPVAAAGPDPLVSRLRALPAAAAEATPERVACTNAPVVAVVGQGQQMEVVAVPAAAEPAKAAYVVSKAELDDMMPLPKKEQPAPATAGAAAQERCPRCKTRLNAMSGCDLCGWPTAQDMR
jgi:hypothetical protein